MAKKKVGKVNQGQEVSRISGFTKYKWEALIFAFAFILYANCIPNNYNMDDELVTRNHRLTSKGISAIPEIFTSFYYKDESGYAYEYRPIVLASFAVEHQIFGDNPYISHFFNVLFYSLCCVLLYRVLLLLLNEEWVLLALAITFLFVVHPAHTEVVASIKNRDDILSLIFSLLSVYIALRAVIRNKKWLLILSPLALALGLLSKMTAFSFVVIIPAVLILFTDAGFITVMAISFLLILVSMMFVTNIYDTYERGIRIIEFMALVASLYGLANITQLYNRAKMAIKQLPLKKHEMQAPLGNGWEQFSFDNLFKNIIPDGSFFSFWPVFITSISTAAYLFGFYSAHSSVSLVAIVILIFSRVYKNRDLAVWANLAILVCIVFTFLGRPFTNESIFGAIAFISLLYQVFLGDRRLFIPSIILSACLIYFCISNGVMSQTALVYLFLIAIHVIVPIVAFRLKRPWLGVIPILILALVLTGTIIGIAQNHVGLTNIQLPLYGYVFSLFILLALLFNLNLKRIFTTGIFLALLVVINPIVYNPLNDIRGIKAGTQEKIDDYGKKVEIHILPTEQDRPLLYLEQPVNAKDPWQIRTGTSMEILFQYLHKVILPYPMAFYYGYKFIKPQKITDPIPLLSLILYLILAILTIIFIYKDRNIAIGLIIYLASVAAASNYFMPVPGQLGERFLLIPSLGWAIILGAILFRLFKLKGGIKNFHWSGLNRNARYVFMGIMLFYSAITFARNFNWKDDLTLFQHDISYVEQSAQAHNLLALHLMQHSMVVNNDQLKQEEYWKEALVHFKRSYQIYPNFYNVAFDLGRLYSLLKESDSSVLYFQRAISIDSSNTDAYTNAGSILIGQKKFAQAIPYFECQLRRHPNTYGGYENLSFIYYNLGDYQKSISVNRAAVQKTPPLPDPLINIAQTFLTMNQADSAYFYVQQALRVDPTNPRANKLLSNFRRNP